MSELPTKREHPVFITQQQGMYHLRSPEVLLTISAPTLKQAHDELLRRRQEINEYPVFVAQRKGMYQLHIRELLLAVSAPNLQQAYDELLKRKRQLIECARDFGVLDELPMPNSFPAQRSTTCSPRWLRWVRMRLHIAP